ncbi:hypothetical protein JQS43_04395 [Natronosporangium hydrolyticum]|uniref:TPR repeat domain-containing protein n=1 Tax=Natronosporangium hydrolyticum TaxID=2811111 RepID=A0A895YCT3_9ACTN|nr:hypothetical protein [Natronosporangium hydrolyticum]QSB15597.1 hypothetical protein JQS43_04395 [Natronosporangium hydrolyticum]
MTMAIDGGGRSGPFARYPVRPETVQSSGDRIAAFAGDVESLHDAVTGAHRPAQQGVAGLLTMPMVAAEDPVRRKAQRWLGSALFAGGAVRLFSEAVAEYNRQVDDLNSRYWEAKRNNFGIASPTLAPDATAAERTEANDEFRESVSTAEQDLLRELRNRFHRVIEPQLDDDADHVAGLLDRGPDDEEAVLALYSAGTLPAYAPVFFPQHDFTQVPLQDLPNGTLLAERMQLAMDGELPPEEFLEMMVWLEMMAGRIEYVQQHGNASLSEDELKFLHYFYAQMGDRIWELPDYIQAEEHRWDGGGFNPWGWRDERSDGFDQATQERMLGALGTGLLGLSNPELWPPHLRGQDPMDPQSRYHLPQTVIDLVSQPSLDAQQTMQYPHLGPLVDRLDDFAKLSTMFAHVPADVEGGTRFSELTTQRVAELAFAAQMYQDGGFGRGITTASPLVNTEAVAAILEPLLEVSTRNEEANYRLLTGEGLGPMERTALKHPDANYHHYDDQAFLLNALYGFQWSDDGAAAAGLTNWISERAQAAALNGEYDPMATEAAAALIDLVTMTAEGEGHQDDPRIDTYDSLMRSLSQHNPEIARSFSRIAASYLGDFSEPSGPATRVEGNGSLSLSDHDKIRFLDLVATDEQAINALSFAAGEYQQRLLEAGLAGETSMLEVGQRHSHLDALLAASRIHAGLVQGSHQHELAMAAYEEHMRWASYGKSAVTTTSGAVIGATPLKPVGPFLNAGLGHMVDDILAGYIAPPTRDNSFDHGGILDLGRDNTYAAHEYLTAMIATDSFPEDREIPTELLLTEPPDETPVYVDGRPVLKPVADLDGDERNDLFLLVGNETDGVGGDAFRFYRNEYQASSDFQRVFGRDPENHRQGLR